MEIRCNGNGKAKLSKVVSALFVTSSLCFSITIIERINRSKIICAIIKERFGR